ncbi:MAG: LPS-assembly protein LptD [Bacteroidales bacterium]|nr:LPS-assembly protein LptD [Bacteroidales bacterium]
MLKRIILLMMLFELVFYPGASMDILYASGAADRPLYQSEPDTITAFIPDTLVNGMPDSLAIILPDTLVVDSAGGKVSEDALGAKVEYQSFDSIYFDIVNKKVYMFNNAVIVYGDINLQAAYIEIDFEKNELYATGLPDSTGKMTGLPIFKQGDQEFKSKTMRYNYKSKKGLIKGVITEDGSGYLHGDVVKKMSDDVANISSGSYTTCELEDHPHFEFRYNKSKVIPKKRIVTGPAFLVVEDVPTPLAIPFGFFPNKQGQRSGVVLPTYGESKDRGFYFEGGGYYFYINDYLDFKVLGDIYTLGSWAVRPSFRYKKRYKYTGSANFTYAINITGVKETPDYSRKRDFRIQWSHRQDPKARPKSTFSADVNIVSSTLNRYNPSTTQDFLSNTFRSSIAYQTNFAGKYFLTINAAHDQNTITKIVNVTLPELTFSVNRFNPFLSKKKVGPNKWYHNIAMNYNLNARNTVTAADSVIFTPEALDLMKNGIKHAMPISSPVKLLKYFNWTNTINLNDRMYFESYRKYWSNDTLFENNDTIVGYLVKDTINGFNNIFDYGFSSSLSTKVYGMIQFGENFPVRAIRHVFTPTVSFSYRPDFASDFWGYYDTYFDEDGEEVRYSKYEGALYGGPPSGKSGAISFSFANNLEMKIRSRKDTITGTKKMGLIDNFSINFSYDIARDSLNWSPLSLSGRTRLFKNFDITYRSQFDPYILDSTGTKNLNKTEWSVNRRLLRLENTNWSVNVNYRLNSKEFGKKDAKEAAPSRPVVGAKEELPGTETEIEDVIMNPDDYIDWSIPWDLTISYSFNYNVVRNYPDYVLVREEGIIQTLGLSGNVNITPKWKVGFMTGWDFEASDLSYTSINIYRDLHCWEMRFSWIPTGYQQSWNFTINAKAALLQDLKLNKKKDFRDNF